MAVSTAFWIAAVRARETARPDRLFADPYAHDLAGPHGYAIMAASERAAGEENTFIPVRTRWFDDLVLSAAQWVRQVVFLGAGLDTRAYRLSLPSDLGWYELDRTEVFAAKDKVLAGQAPTCRRRVVEGDISDTGTGWAEGLLTAGFDQNAPTLWLAEGVFFYLTEAAILGLLYEAGRQSGEGSRFAADVVGAAGLDAPVMDSYRAWCARNGVPPPFGSDDPVALLAAGGWEVEHVTAPGAPAAGYGRLPAQAGGVAPGRTHLVTARHGRHHSAMTGH